MSANFTNIVGNDVFVFYLFTIEVLSVAIETVFTLQKPLTMLVMKKGPQQRRKTPMMTPTVMVALCSSTRLWLSWCRTLASCRGLGSRSATILSASSLSPPSGFTRASSLHPCSRTSTLRASWWDSCTFSCHLFI